jgi:hypothetical protein
MNEPNAAMSALTVQLWEAGSHIEYYIGSQSLELNTLASSTGLLEVPAARLAGSQSKVVELEHGGMYVRHSLLEVLSKFLIYGLGYLQILDSLSEL